MLKKGITLVFFGWNFVAVWSCSFNIGTMKISTDSRSAATPPSFDGIARKMAYANKKYHSGWMCVGVVSGFASVKFSGSEVTSGECLVSMMDAIDNIKIGVRSFLEKNGWKFVFSAWFFPSGLDEPVSCKNDKCKITKAAISSGMMKCREKNRVRVGWATEKPPHSHCTRLVPKYGIAEKMFVMTVAPQKDICPHGSTYPRKAVAMAIKRIISPDAQVVFLVCGEVLKRPRAMCTYISIKNRLAPVLCRDRRMCPLCRFRFINTTVSKAWLVLDIKCMEIIKPVIICKIRQVASMEPMFHI